MTAKIAVLQLVAFILLPACVWAQVGDQQSATSPHQQLEQVALIDVLDAVKRNDDRSFLIDSRAAPTIVIGQAGLNDIDYSTLLVILRNNGLAAVNVEGTVSVVPVNMVRQFPLPVLYEEDESLHDEEWVTWIVRTQNAAPGAIVPLIRPIMPQGGHFAASPESQSILLVDRYGNAKRIVALIGQLDAATPPDR